MQQNSRAGSRPNTNGGGQGAEDRSQVVPPTISLPKGGGRIRGIAEKFSANPVTGTGTMTVPIFTSLERRAYLHTPYGDQWGVASGRTNLWRSRFFPIVPTSPGCSRHG